MKVAPRTGLAVLLFVFASVVVIATGRATATGPGKTSRETGGKVEGRAVGRQVKHHGARDCQS